MAITNFISTIWSENLYRELDKQYIAVSHCSRDFEGDIKNVGSTVKICGVGAVGVSDYTKNTDMSTPQDLSDTVTTLKIDRAKYFNFQIDDIDRAQSTPKLMEAAMSIAASALANETDKYIFSLFSEAQSNVCCENVTPENILDNIIMARQKLYENNVLDASDIVIEVSPQIASVILRAKIDLSTDNSASLEAGYLGSIAGCKIYVSNNIKQEELNDSFHHMCFVRTKRAIAFAEQLSEIEAYRPEKRFADAVKGLHLYGAKVVYPQELVCLELGLPIVIE
jgi:hypothetical protein